MKRITWIATAGALAIATLLGALAGSGVVAGHLIAIFVTATSLAYLGGRAAATDRDAWLPTLVAWAMVAKLIGSTARYYVLEIIYEGSGDADRYHDAGTVIAATWRTLSVPDVATVGFGSEGTRFVTWITGLVYSPFEPSLLGGFWIFAVMAFIGQFFLYLAFRRVSPSSNWKRYALLILFWPTLVYWPSSIGKEAVIILFLGLGSWGAANLYRRYTIRWLPVVAGSAAVIGMVRVHVAALFVGSLMAGLLLSKRPRGADIASRRVIAAGVGIVALIPLAVGLSQQFDIDVNSSMSLEDIDPVFSDVERTTGQGGSAVSSGAIRSPADVPGGILKVLFRPLPNEATNFQTAAASLEGLLLLMLVVWRLPTILSRTREIRRHPYLIFSLVYTLVFIWAWSAINNLGILARQRSLVLPFVLVLIAALGWPATREATDISDPDSPSSVSGPTPRTGDPDSPVLETTGSRR